MRQEYVASNSEYLYNGNSTYKIKDQQNMAIMYNDSWIGQKGMMWYNRTVNLNYSFEVESYFLVQAPKLRGGGMGVYPAAANTSNIIYNALSAEFETANNFKTITDGASHDKNLDRATTTPHMAVGSTYVGTTNESHGKDTTEVMNNFTHDALLTPSKGGIILNKFFTDGFTHTEGDSWYYQ